MSFQKLSFIEQMANIGIEIYRMQRWKKNKEHFQSSFNRALDLLIKTINDKKNKKYSRLKELSRLKTILIDVYLGGQEYNTKIENLTKYFDYFINLYSKLQKLKI